MHEPAYRYKLVKLSSWSFHVQKHGFLLKVPAWQIATCYTNVGLEQSAVEILLKILKHISLFSIAWLSDLLAAGEVTDYQVILEECAQSPQNL